MTRAVLGERRFYRAIGQPPAPVVYRPAGRLLSAAWFAFKRPGPHIYIYFFFKAILRRRDAP